MMVRHKLEALVRPSSMGPEEAIRMERLVCSLAVRTQLCPWRQRHQQLRCASRT